VVRQGISGSAWVLSSSNKQTQAQTSKSNQITVAQFFALHTSHDIGEISKMSTTETKVEYMSLTNAAELFPVRPNYSTVYRWATEGVRGVILQTIKSGIYMYTTREWVEQFQRNIEQR
jgi:hypothetical protein